MSLSTCWPTDWMNEWLRNALLDSHTWSGNTTSAEHHKNGKSTWIIPLRMRSIGTEELSIPQLARSQVSKGLAQSSQYLHPCFSLLSLIDREIAEATFCQENSWIWSVRYKSSHLTCQQRGRPLQKSTGQGPPRQTECCAAKPSDSSFLFSSRVRT